MPLSSCTTATILHLFVSVLSGEEHNDEKKGKKNNHENSCLGAVCFPPKNVGFPGASLAKRGKPKETERRSIRSELEEIALAHIQRNRMAPCRRLLLTLCLRCGFPFKVIYSDFYAFGFRSVAERVRTKAMSGYIERKARMTLDLR